jgi:glycosyltransferase involved in cell wall biosynthesis
MTELLENKRILIFLRSLRMGGAERQAILLANHLKYSQKADVQVWAFFDGQGRGAEILEKHNIPVHIHQPDWEGGLFKKIRGLLRLIRDIRRFRPHFIMPFTDYPNKVCGAVWKFTGARCCIWNQRDEGREITGKPVERLALKLTPFYVSNSIEGKRFLTDTFSIPGKKVTIIHNAVRLEEAQKTPIQWRRELQIDEATFIAVMVAHLQPFKDHPTLLEAWHRVLDKTGKQQPPVLLLAGRFDETYPQLQFLASDLKLGNAVRFLREVKDIPGLLKAVDLSVYSSKFEGCPNGVLESMAAGLPVVATNITGIAEALGEDYPFLVPPNNSEVFADYILKFIAQRDLRRRTGDENYQRVSTLFKPERVFERYTALLRKTLDKKLR